MTKEQLFALVDMLLRYYKFLGFTVIADFLMIEKVYTIKKL